jgi:hypothetical protein
MDRLAELSHELTSVLAELRDEANRRDLARLAAPLHWLDEAERWLNYEIVRQYAPSDRDPVPFTYVPAHLRK